jgi:hypothetical protein
MRIGGILTMQHPLAHYKQLAADAAALSKGMIDGLERVNSPETGLIVFYDGHDCFARFYTLGGADYFQEVRERLPALAAAVAELAGECERLTEELDPLTQELRAAELSSATGAVDVLFKALGWSSGGLTSAAIEIVTERDRLKAELAELQSENDRIRERYMR